MRSDNNRARGTRKELLRRRLRLAIKSVFRKLGVTSERFEPISRRSSFVDFFPLRLYTHKKETKGQMVSPFRLIRIFFLA